MNRSFPQQHYKDKISNDHIHCSQVTWPKYRMHDTANSAITWPPYRIQNCFSTISTNILVNRYYFCDLWRILECKSLWITHIFAIYSDLSVVSIVMVISAMPNHQFWWFLVWFICRITKFFANSSDFHSDYICFFASTLAQFGYHFYRTRVRSLVMLVSELLTP